MNEERQVLRVGIDGTWEVGEFAASFNALDRLYTLRFALALELEELRELRDLYMGAPFPPFPRSLRSLRAWARLAPPSILRSGRAPLLGLWQAPIAVASELLEPDERLAVQRVLYGSPGIKDLVGIGEIVGHVKDLLVRLIEHWSTRRQRSLENERRELENQQLQVEIAKQFVGLAQELGYTKKETRQLVSAVVLEQRPLVRLVSAGKITSADTITGEPPS
jgi:HAMP domain-containing protein